jgi:hypothetical protein
VKEEEQQREERKKERPKMTKAMPVAQQEHENTLNKYGSAARIMDGWMDGWIDR